MRLAESREQRELRASVRKFLTDKQSLDAVRVLMDTPSGYDAAVWEQASSQLGLPALAIPEQYGGAGFTFVEQAIVLEELGRALYSGPYFASAVLAANAILCCGDEQARQAHLPGIAAGETIATLALGADELTAEDGRLTGRRDLVLEGATASLILVTTDESLFAVAADAPGVTVIPVATLDQTRRLATITFADAPASVIGSAEPLVGVLDRAAVALAAEQLGGAQAALDMAVAYAKTREQFNRPIGTFQTIKHRCADLLLEVESTRSAVQYAAWAVADGSDELPTIAPLVKAYASDTFSHAAAENIQIHGGIGFTWEHDAQLYFKRAHFDQQFLGDPAEHRERLVQRIGI
ncbi:MAG TPA: acyl-CoA dehydrogenase family protein [Pseudonocardiaceae bacterium]|jgi:alkylation response protein AidB-like acyl-CoA dehydrogenase